MKMVLKLLSTGWSLAVSKGRLMFGYSLVFAIVLLTSGSLALWYQTKEMAAKNELLLARIARNHELIEKQAVTIERLEEQRKRDDRATAAMVRKMDRIYQSDQDTRRKLNSLEARNAEVRGFMDTPLPDDLRGLLKPGADKKPQPRFNKP